ncbi:hypothetical protein G7043_39325 [Lentzea sp. NEAU-D13]|uniref:Uncharacterized protein n=1 Tax=Lentzea alba TaxID=2714351 RepID=A0A7C9RX13_9PSEU|nr:hypothetical protein [Lentzea alba]NGY64984.1 hypothetical protein [Lentzea alba]
MREHAKPVSQPARPVAATPPATRHQLEALQRQVGNTAVNALVQRDPVPGFSQRGDTCHPASLLTAFLVWDRDLASPGRPHGNMLSACDGALLYLQANRPVLITRLGGATGYGRVVATVNRVRAALAAPGAAMSEPQFQELAEALSQVFDDSASALRAMGGQATSDAYDTLDLIFHSAQLTGLTPGQIAQIEWYVHTRVIQNGQSVAARGYHVFLIGRQADGSWYLSDQGTTPALVLHAPNLDALRTSLNAAAASGQSWIDTRPTQRRHTLDWTGVHLLTAPEQIEPRHRRLLPPGQPLGVVNPGWRWRDIPLVTWDWVGMASGLAGARALFPGSGHGHSFVIGELPVGVFNVAKATPVTQQGLSGTFTPAGLLATAPPQFLHAWLQLGTASGALAASLTSVY